MSPRLSRALLLAVLCTGVACASFLEPSATDEERRAYAAAERSAESGGDAERRAFETFLARYPDSALAPDAALRLGGLARRAGDLEQAERRYRQALDRGGVAGDRARVQLAILALEEGDAVAARRWLDRVRLTRLRGADLRNAYRAYAETSGRSAERVRWLSLLRSEVPDPADLASIDDEIDAVLAELSLPELEEAARRVADKPPAGRIFVALAERALQNGDVEAASSALEQARRRPMAARYAHRLAALDANLRSHAAPALDEERLLTFDQVSTRPEPRVASARGSIGVVLPLTGPYARFGERALEGVLLAAGTFPEENGALRPQIRVMVRDSAGDPARAAAAVRELSEDASIVAIVGPLVSAACEAAAREAEARAIPLIALSAREDVARGRAWAFRLGTRPAEEVAVLADRAAQLGAKRFAILYPNDPYGLGLRGLFWDAVEARGGQIVAVASFDPNATDFGESIRRLVGYTLLDAEQKRLLAQREGMLSRARRLPDAEARSLRRQARSLTTRDGSPIPPIVDFDAIFLPASHDDVLLIAPQLAFHEVTGPRLLGTDSGYDDELLRLSAEHVEGALFASHFDPASPVPYLVTFRRRFDHAFGALPDAFAAQSYDATRLVLLQLANGGRDRRDVREGLLEISSYPGVSGVVSMRADGNAHKRPYLLGIEDGRVVHFTD